MFNKTGNFSFHGRTFPFRLQVLSRKKRSFLSVLIRRGQPLVNYESIFLCTVGFFFGRATVFGEAAPFGIIFWLLVLRIRPSYSYFLALFIFLGRLSIFSGLYLIGLPLAMVMIWLIEGVYLRLLGRRPALLLQASLAPFWTRVPLFLFARHTLFDSFIFGIEVVMGVFCVILLKPLIMQLDQSFFAEFKQETISAGLLVAGILLLGAGDINLVAGITLQGFFAHLLLICGSYLFGAGWGAVAALLLGLFLLVTVVAVSSEFVLALVIAGFLAGTLHKFGRLLTAFGFLLGSWIFFYVLLEGVGGAGGGGGFALMENFAAVFVFLLIPTSSFQYLEDRRWWFDFSGTVEKEEALLGVASRRIKDFSRIFKELGDIFAQEVKRENILSSSDISPLLHSLAKKTCQECLFRRRCWDEEFYKNYTALLEMFAVLENKEGVSEEDIPKEILKRCTKPGELFKAAKELREMYEFNQQWQAQLRENRQVVSNQLNGVSAVMSELADKIRPDPGFKERRKVASRFVLEIGVAQAACKGGQTSGDYYSIIELKSSRQVVILSDGMGTGMRAQLESKATVGLIEQLLEAGFDRDLVLRTVNSLLRLRSSEETFATVDLFVFDLVEGEFEILKIGAVPSYLKRKDEIKELRAVSLPMGILTQIDVDVQYERMEDKDLLVIFTDGLLEAVSGGEEWIQGFLRQTGEREHVQFIADRFLDTVSARPEDDITVIVCRMKKL